MGLRLSKVNDILDLCKKMIKISKDEETLDKITFNNQLVCMRKAVTAAKTKVTRQLIRHVKRLRETLAKGETKKNNNKLDKILDELKEIKHLEKDEISKFAIVNTKSFSEGMNNMNLTSRDRCLLRISTNKQITDVVEKFRKKYPEWESQVPFIIKVLGIKRQVTK